jgi:hypothetical protein
MISLRLVPDKTLAQAQSPVEKSVIRERKQYPALDAYSLGGKRMGLMESQRPVVLVVEDEFFLRMDAVDMI